MVDDQRSSPSPMRACWVKPQQARFGSLSGHLSDFVRSPHRAQSSHNGFYFQEIASSLRDMKTALPLILFSTVLLSGTSALSKPVDMTGLSCERSTNLGLQIWDFYGDIATRRYSDGRPQRFIRIGEGAYERFSRLDGEWDAIYYFFDDGSGVHMRIFSRPGTIVRDENPKAPWDEGVFPFAADCQPLWERR